MSGITPFSSNLQTHPNIPYFILIGYELMEEQDFDFNIGFWDVSDPSDNATTGLWEIGVPEGTFYDGTVPVTWITKYTPSVPIVLLLEMIIQEERLELMMLTEDIPL